MKVNFLFSERNGETEEKKPPKVENLKMGKIEEGNCMYRASLQVFFFPINLFQVLLFCFRTFLSKMVLSWVEKCVADKRILNGEVQYKIISDGFNEKGDLVHSNVETWQPTTWMAPDLLDMKDAFNLQVRKAAAAKVQREREEAQRQRNLALEKAKEKKKTQPSQVISSIICVKLCLFLLFFQN